MTSPSSAPTPPPPRQDSSQIPPDSPSTATLLRTGEYVAFCQRVAGRFIHHLPTDSGPHDVGDPHATLGNTIKALTSSGFAVDTELWEPGASLGKCTDDGDDKCHQCHTGCYNSP